MNYADLPGMNVSKLKDAYTDGWFQFAALHIYKTMRKEKKPFSLGTAIHLALLQPHLFADTIAVPPADVLAKNRARSTKAYEEWASAQVGKVVLSKKELDTCNECIASIKQHDQVRSMLAQSNIIETPISADIDGMRWKGIPDIVDNTYGRYVIDVKSTGFIDEREFRWQVKKLGYHIQAAWYLRLCSAAYDRNYDTFIFIAIETQPPFRCRCYYLSKQLIDEGNYEIDRLLREYNERMQSGDWREDCDRALILI